jgi:hypothetical protein
MQLQKKNRWTLASSLPREQYEIRCTLLVVPARVLVVVVEEAGEEVVEEVGVEVRVKLKSLSWL